MSEIMKGITCCADCAYYSMKKHRCTRATDEGKPTDRFYADCPLPTVTKPQGWVSVKDRLPDISIEYIVCAIDEDGEQFVTSDHWLDTVRHWYLFDEHADSVVTHWMPMPEPPKEGDGE